MKRFVLAIALACALSGAALAGEIPSTGAPAPGEIPSTGSPAPGDGHTGERPGEMPMISPSILTMILDLAF